MLQQGRAFSPTLLPGSRHTLQPPLPCLTPLPSPSTPLPRNIATYTSVHAGGRASSDPPCAASAPRACPCFSPRERKKPAARATLTRRRWRGRSARACGRSARARRRQRGLKSAGAASVHAVSGAPLLHAAGRARLLRRVDRGHGRHEAHDQRRKGQAARLPHLRARAAASALHSASAQGRGRRGRRDACLHCECS